MAAYNYLSPQGLIVPDTSQILTDTENEWKSAFGDDLDVTPDTPQGMIIASDVAVRSEMAANNAAVANQINPNYSGGVFLDDIWALTGGKRREAAYTLVDGVLLTGIPGVVIPSGSRRSSNGNLFELLSTVTLSNTGSGTGIFQALESGPVPCPAHSLTAPVSGYTSVGWETSDNPVAGTLGAEEQSDLSARKERTQTLAIQGRSISEAVFSNVRAVNGVKSLSFRENVEATTKTIDKISLIGHSVWACVDGGEDSIVAEALYRSKTGGTNWNGAVEVTITDRWSGQSSKVKFDRPTAKPVMVKFTVVAKGIGTGDPASLIKDTIIKYASGQLENGEEGFVLGVDVSPFELSAAANTASPQIFIKSVEISLKAVAPTWSKDDIEIGLNEKATIQVDDILVVTT
ncbi:Uncharacterized homolog of phage Mu protein gp47 [Buttiauxella agrestis]|uniref:Uncharacterized homolog of phage Mu protein gp47 n=1 Tax=Buttiauxella agrestis TaxID=82977 RepID=A0A381C6G4_9ENTR|nr:hypothetical protein [Buttiauxella agrestis]SUW63488.1 Uncharacterized homolog of phage Mu protein gp47 [Buttiauxella agrestis]